MVVYVVIHRSHLFAVVTFSWVYFDGDVTFQRLLNSDGTTKYPHPENFSFFQIIAPLVLLILTRMRMPVSTTFLILSVFSADTSGNHFGSMEILVWLYHGFYPFFPGLVSFL